MLVQKEESRLGEVVRFIGKVVRFIRTAPDTALGQFVVGGSIIALGNWYTSVQGLPGLQVALTTLASTGLTISNLNSIQATMNDYFKKIPQKDLETWKRNLLKYGGPALCLVLEALAAAGYGAGTYQEGAKYVAYLATACAVLAAAPTLTRLIYEYPIGKWWLASKQIPTKSIEELQDELRKALEDVNSLTEDKTVLESELEDAKADRDNLRLDFEKANKDKIKLEQKIKIYAEQRDAVQQALNEVEKQLKAKELENKNLMSEMNSVGENNIILQTQLRALEEKRNKSLEEIKNLNMIMSNLKNEVEHLKTIESELKKEQEQNRNELEMAKKEIERLRGSKQQTQSQQLQPSKTETGRKRISSEVLYYLALTSGKEEKQRQKEKPLEEKSKHKSPSMTKKEE